MNFDLAQIPDIPALHALVESAYRGESAKQGWTHEADLLDGQRTDAKALRAIITDRRQVIFLAKKGPAIAGCVQLSNIGNRLAYLGLLTVDPALQAAGLGKELLLQSEQHVREHWQAEAIEMTVIRQRADLIAYYERRGYVLTGEHRPFPHGDARFGLPKSSKLEFAVLRKPI
ncbi:MAG: GNAT family N-acetyltransferase [Sphingorhabdus sp.]